MTTFSVFRQSPAILESHPEAQEKIYRVNFEYVGNVEARSSEAAFDIARTEKRVRFPVIQERSMQ